MLALLRILLFFVHYYLDYYVICCWGGLRFAADSLSLYRRNPMWSSSLTAGIVDIYKGRSVVPFGDVAVSLAECGHTTCLRLCRRVSFYKFYMSDK